VAEELYDTIVSIVEDYLGPAAGRFVDRQIEYHLHKRPTQVAGSDLQQLTEWIRVSLAVLTNDHTIIDDCVGRLARLHEPIPN
jgi:hypothetical protein